MYAPLRLLLYGAVANRLWMVFVDKMADVSRLETDDGDAVGGDNEPIDDAEGAHLLWYGGHLAEVEWSISLVIATDCFPNRKMDNYIVGTVTRLMHQAFLK